MCPKSPITILLTCDEESGSPSGRSLVEEEARNARAVLVLEPPASGGRVKTGRKGTGIFAIEVHGRAAHAGLEPEKGVSAVLELARQTIRLTNLNDPAAGTTVTVTVVQGGTHSNVVPAEAHAEIDMRFSSAAEGRRIESAILNLKPFDERERDLVANDHDAQHPFLPKEFGGSCPSRFDGGVPSPCLGHSRGRATSARSS